MISPCRAHYTERIRRTQSRFCSSPFAPADTLPSVSCCVAAPSSSKNAMARGARRCTWRLRRAMRCWSTSYCSMVPTQEAKTLQVLMFFGLQ
jgi:hypothetical protein